MKILNPCINIKSYVSKVAADNKVSEYNYAFTWIYLDDQKEKSICVENIFSKEVIQKSKDLRSMVDNAIIEYACSISNDPSDAVFEHHVFFRDKENYVKLSDFIREFSNKLEDNRVRLYKDRFMVELRKAKAFKSTPLDVKEDVYGTTFEIGDIVTYMADGCFIPRISEIVGTSSQYINLINGEKKSARYAIVIKKHDGTICNSTLDYSSLN